MFLLFVCQLVAAQNTFRAVIQNDAEEPELLEGATANVAGTSISALSDSNGIVILQNIPDGAQTIEVSYLGYFKQKIHLTFPQPSNAGLIQITLESQAHEVEEVIVSTTRNYQKADYIPTRVEVIGEEEVEERSHDKPSDVSHVVREQPGVQVQRTSATAGTMGIRLQGLNSRYAQILKDGFPLFGGFSNVIGITQIPPLDLQQVEIIKGPSSILYGSDAISGVINLISKQPTEKPVYDVMLNGESAVALDAGAYASQKFKWIAFSFMGAYRHQREKDWDGDKFTETPRLDRYTFSPQLYFDISKKATLNMGATYTHENRLGGALPYLEGKTDTTYSYFEKNNSGHFSSNFKFVYDFGANSGKLTLRNSFNLFDRNLTLPFYHFQGRQLASVSEINYRLLKDKHDVVVGFDFRTDKFMESPDSSPVKRNYNFRTLGLFSQYLYHVNANTALEVGLRFDYFNFKQVFVLPHLAALHKWNNVFSTRVNFGMGYKLPTIFQDESEEARFINVAPIASAVKPEFSVGGTLDLKVKFPSAKGFNVTISQLYFVTHIFQPVLASTDSVPNCPNGECNGISYNNAQGYIQSLGVENGLYMSYRGISASIVYTLTDNHRRINQVQGINPLTSKHIISILAGYEIKNFFIGLDCYYYSPVRLANGATGKRIWEIGINTQYAFRYLILFANFENIANIRQTSYGPVVFPNPTYARPQFSQIYGPLEGRLLNIGVKVRLGYFAKKGGSGGVDRLKGKDND